MQPFQFENPRHKEIYEKLTFIGPGPAAFFKDILRIWEADKQVFESETHLISHLFREIESALRDTLRTEDEKPKSGNKNHLEDVINILQKLDIPLDHPVAEIWLRFADKSFEHQLNKLAHRKSLQAPRKRRAEIEESWNEFLLVLEFVIEKFRENFFIATKLIDDVLKKDNPSKKDVKIITGNIPHNQTTLSYLFDNCDNPQWLPLFRQKGLFQHPPTTIYNEDGSWRYPSWPAGKFIQKMAPNRPDEISEIIREVPETENLNAIDDLVFALGTIPPEVASEHTSQVVKWAEKGSLSYRAEPYQEYALHLAKHGFIGEALQVLKVLLTPDYPEEPEEQYGLQRSMSNYLRISDFEFRNFFDKEIQQFVPHLGFELAILLSEILGEVLLFSSTDPPNDGSNIWMRRIRFEDQESSRYRYEVKETLVDSITSLSDQLINEKVIEVERVTDFLDSFDWLIFKRINALLLSRYEKKEEVRKILLNKKHFDGYGLHTEYRILLNRHFLSLSEKDQQAILNWIDKGPPPNDIQNHFEHYNEEATEENITKYVEHWKRRKMFPIAEYLDGERKTYYEKLVETYGEPDFEESGVQSYVGPTTPKTIPELEGLSVPELIDYLKNWEPEEGFAKPTPEGLGRALSSMIAEQADAYSKQALQFKDLDPTYVRSLLEGLRSALENSEAFEWNPVLKLAEWVLKQPESSTKNEPYQSKDPNWSWTRKTIAGVLELGCGRTTSGLSFTFRDRVWSCIKILTEDSNPDEEHEATNGGSNMDPATLSINTVRGKAMHAVIYYGWWVKRHLDEDDQKISFDHIPEVRTVLERHLDMQIDPSKAIHSVYGRFIPSLFQFDRQWLKDHLCDIFPSEQEHLDYFFAAWNTYISFNKPYNDVFEVMAPIYSLALKKITGEDSENYLRSRRKLVQHLIILYWRGEITVAGKHSKLIHVFWNEAPEDLRGHAFEFTGRCLNEWTEDVDVKFIERIEDYTRRRIKIIKNDKNVNIEYNNELAAYGWCFTSDKLDPEQRILHLLEILHITGKVDSSHSVMKTLHKEFVEEYPEKVLECTTLMIKSADRSMRLFGWKRDLKEILKILLDKKEPIAKKAEGLLQYICQKSYHLMQEFKPLLDK